MPLASPAAPPSSPRPKHPAALPAAEAALAQRAEAPRAPCHFHSSVRSLETPAPWSTGGRVGDTSASRSSDTPQAQELCFPRRGGGGEAAVDSRATGGEWPRMRHPDGQRGADCACAAPPLSGRAAGGARTRPCPRAAAAGGR